MELDRSPKGVRITSNVSLARGDYIDQYQGTANVLLRELLSWLGLRITGAKA